MNPFSSTEKWLTLANCLIRTWKHLQLS